MLLKMILTMWIAAILLNAIPSSEQSSSELNGSTARRRVEKRQAPWLFPQPYPTFVNPTFLPTIRESWRFPCRPYPPSYPPYTPPIQPPFRPRAPSSSSDDSSVLLDRVGGGNEQTKSKKEPSRCVWAIVACCSPGSRDIRYSCFEVLGCPGAFWDVNPCDESIVASAASSALAFYSHKSNGTSNSTSS